MITDTYKISSSRQTGCSFDILLVSRDENLYKQLSSFLKEFEPDRKLQRADESSSLGDVETVLNQCDVVICDIRKEFAAVELGARVFACAPAETLSIGLTDGHDSSSEILSLPQNLRLAGIINITYGWRSNWHQISAVRAAWHNPVMVSRIEEIPVGDVLQMISSGHWNSIAVVDDMQETGTVISGIHRGCISFFQGEPHTAWSWRNSGIEAIFDLLSVRQGVFQVIKNHCSPSIRNVFLQTEEILLSYAVALDESGVPEKSGGNQPQIPSCPKQNQVLESSGKTAGISPSEEPVSSGPDETWWKCNAGRLKSLLSETEKKSLPLRRMTEKELTLLIKNQPESTFFSLVGNEQIINKVFSVCARGFSFGEETGDSRFPVMRLGTSGKPCLYIIGINSAMKCESVFDHHTALVVTSENETAVIDDCKKRFHKSLHLITHGVNIISGADHGLPSVILKDCTWPDVKLVLSAIFMNLTKID